MTTDNHRCTSCGATNATIKSSIRTRKDGSKAWRYICHDCKRQQNRKFREEGYLSMPKHVTPISWSDEERRVWYQRAKDSRQRIVAKYGRPAKIVSSVNNT